MHDTSAMHTTPTEPPGGNPVQARRANPVLWMVVALPLLAVAASFVSLALAVTRGDKELPSTYHWEGDGLAGDEARIAAAAKLGLRATVQVDSAGERCSVQVPGVGSELLHLDLAHPTEPSADRHVTLRRSSDGSRYEARCAALAPAHWWVQLSDAGGQWLLRGRASGALDAGLVLSPSDPAAAAGP
jgi:hypothetical protein